MFQQPQVFEVRGDKIVRIQQGDRRWPATLSPNGTANLIVDALGPSGKTTLGLLNEIGHYSGTVLLKGQDGRTTAALMIQADGDWTLRFTPPTDARVWNAGALHGHGDDAVRPATPRPSSLHWAATTVRCVRRLMAYSGNVPV